MSLTGKDIAEIAKLLDASHFTSLDLQQGEFKLRIRRNGAGVTGWREDADELEAVAETADEPEEDQPKADQPSPAAAPSAGPGKDEVDIIAPLLGNFYSAPRPGEPAFVEIGQTITEDTTVAIIEVMKLMNSVRAGVAGTVTAMLVENGKAVEEGQALIRVKVA